MDIQWHLAEKATQGWVVAVQLTVEVVYNLVQGVLYSCIVYFSIGFGTDASASRIILL